MTDRFDSVEEIGGGSKANMPLAEVSARNDLGLEFVSFAKEQMFADADFATGTNQAFPLVGILMELAGKEDFDAAAEKVASGRAMRAQRLRFKSGSATVETGRKDFCVVEDQEISGPQQIGKTMELAIDDMSTLRRKMKKAGSGPVVERLLGDEFFGEVEIEIRDEHALKIIGRVSMAAKEQRVGQGSAQRRSAVPPREAADEF